jgi:hypothetical protein
MQKALDIAIEESRDKAGKLELNLSDKEIVDRIFEMMKKYLSE